MNAMERVNMAYHSNNIAYHSNNTAYHFNNMAYHSYNTAYHFNNMAYHDNLCFNTSTSIIKCRTFYLRLIILTTSKQSFNPLTNTSNSTGNIEQMFLLYHMK